MKNIKELRKFKTKHCASFYWFRATNEQIKELRQLNNAILLLETYSNKKQLEIYLLNTLDGLKTMLDDGLRPNKMLFNSNGNVVNSIKISSKEKTIIKEQIEFIQYVLS